MSARAPYNPSPPPPALPMAAPTSLPGGRPRAARPPRIQIHGNGSYMGSMPPTSQIPFTAQTNPTLNGSQGQPYWPAYSNPFAAGNFMSKGFEGFVDFTKSGMSFGEKFTYGLYVKFSKWSKKWFTHIFLFLVVLLYSVGGAVLFRTVEEVHVQQKFNDTHKLQKSLFKAVHDLSQDLELRKFHPDEFNGKLILTLRTHKDAIQSFINSNKTLEELEKFENPWSFWNAMFYCGTIYTTIDKIITM
ncbi:uncharacterized protein LOC129919220 [Episyrphus balteatus]|uniref:uncharacterized protein LOC129919220 n=1 Tax=Episyrphus balteatus TaxID=286459 RepID=UPI002485D736|nr:uncharacterized protein LOC129919220 [Episyrphus balteatus]